MGRGVQLFWDAYLRINSTQDQRYYLNYFDILVSRREEWGRTPREFLHLSFSTSWSKLMWGNRTSWQDEDRVWVCLLIREAKSHSLWLLNMNLCSAYSTGLLRSHQRPLLETDHFQVSSSRGYRPRHLAAHHLTLALYKGLGWSLHSDSTSQAPVGSVV